jgi:hypothetical protein
MNLTKKEIKSFSSQLVADHLRLLTLWSVSEAEVKELQSKVKYLESALVHYRSMAINKSESEQQLKFCFKRMVDMFYNSQDENYKVYVENAIKAYETFFNDKIDIVEYKR